MNHVDQRNDIDCGLACLAMLANNSYERVEKLSINIGGGSGD